MSSRRTMPETFKLSDADLGRSDGGTILMPRFASNLNATATRHSMTVSTRIGAIPERWCPTPECWPAEVVLSTWTGTKAQFAATGFLMPGYRIPYALGWFSLPFGGEHWAYRNRALLCGYIDATGGALEMELYLAPKPVTISDTGDIQIVDYGDQVSYHGTGAALIAGGFCATKQIPTKRQVRVAREDRTLLWLSRRQPDGSVVHWRPRAAIERALEDPKYQAIMAGIVAGNIGDASTTLH